MKHTLFNLKKSNLFITEKKYGWWRIDNEKTFDDVMASLHTRGDREKELHAKLTKYKKYLAESLDTREECKVTDEGNFNSYLKEN